MSLEHEINRRFHAKYKKQVEEMERRIFKDYNMNITKTELPTRPDVVKKFKLECEGKEYIVVQEQYQSTIEAISYNTGNQELTVVHHMHYQDVPTFKEMIKEWNWEHDPFIPLTKLNPSPRDGGSDYNTFEPVTIKPSRLKSNIDIRLFKPSPPTPPEPRRIKYEPLFNIQWLITLLQRIRNLFKKK